MLFGLIIITLVILMGMWWNVMKMQKATQTVLIGAMGTAYQSNDGGQEWVRANLWLTKKREGGQEDGSVLSVAVSPKYSVDKTAFIASAAATDLAGLYESKDGAKNWSNISRGLQDKQFSAVAISPNYQEDKTIFAGSLRPYGSSQKGVSVYLSSSSGKSWNKALTDTSNHHAVSAIVFSPNYNFDQTVFVGTENSSRFKPNGTIFRSTDAGKTWRRLNKPNKHSMMNYFDVSPNFINDRTVISGGFTIETGGGVFISADGGESWKYVDKGLENVSVFSIAFSPNYAKDKTIFVGGDRGLSGDIYKSTDGGHSWKRSNTSIVVHIVTMAVSPNYIKDKTVFAGGWSEHPGKGALYKSMDAGKTWHKVFGGPQEKGDNAVWSIAVSR